MAGVPQDRFPLEFYQVERHSGLFMRSDRNFTPSGPTPLLHLSISKKNHLSISEKHSVRKKAPVFSRKIHFWTFVIATALLLFFLGPIQFPEIRMTSLSSIKFYATGNFSLTGFKNNEPELIKLHTDINIIKSHLGLPLELLSYARRDLALWGNGASIIQELTLPTHPSLNPSKRNIFQMAYNVFSAQSESTHGLDIYLPDIVLEGYPTVGECWEFEGTSGHIGITLSEPSTISAMTITHVHSALVASDDHQKAPRTTRLWGLIRSSDLVTLPPVIQRRQPSSFSATKLTGSQFDKSASFVLLIHGNYNVAASHPVQQYESLDIGHRLKVETVVLEVVDNWGANTTCLYHVGVFGS